MRCPEHLEGGPGLSAAGVFGRLVFFGFSLLPLVGLFLGGFLILRGWPQDRPLGQICMAASVFLYMVLPTLVLAIFGATGLSALIRIMLPA